MVFLFIVFLGCFIYVRDHVVNDYRMISVSKNCVKEVGSLVSYVSLLESENRKLNAKVDPGQKAGQGIIALAVNPRVVYLIVKERAPSFKMTPKLCYISFYHYKKLRENIVNEKYFNTKGKKYLITLVNSEEKYMKKECGVL